MLSDQHPAFKEPLSEGLIRIVLITGDIFVDVVNEAPEFVDPDSDSPALRVSFAEEAGVGIPAFEKSYPLKKNERKSGEQEWVFEIDNGGIWFDISLDEVKDIWMADFNFIIESENPKYLTYNILKLDHKLQWLQNYEPEKGIKSLSEVKKTYKAPKLKSTDTFSGTEILRCAEMLARAVAKIDLRTKGAVVAFNDDHGRLVPLIQALAEKLGYKISLLTEAQRKDLQSKDQKGTHYINLK